MFSYLGYFFLSYFCDSSIKNSITRNKNLIVIEFLNFSITVIMYFKLFLLICFESLKSLFLDCATKCALKTKLQIKSKREKNESGKCVANVLTPGKL